MVATDYEMDNRLAIDNRKSGSTRTGVIYYGIGGFLGIFLKYGAISMIEYVTHAN